MVVACLLQSFELDKCLLPLATERRQFEPRAPMAGFRQRDLSAVQLERALDERFGGGEWSRVHVSSAADSLDGSLLLRVELGERWAGRSVLIALHAVHTAPPSDLTIVRVSGDGGVRRRTLNESAARSVLDCFMAGRLIEVSA